MPQTLTEARWRPLAQQHERLVSRWTQPRLERRAAGRRHPIDDFLWEYYHHRPAQLRVWHPGLDVILCGSPPVAGHRHYTRVPDGWTAALAADDPLWDRLARNLAVLHATAGREIATRCFGMHEWAMVHGLAQEQIRHEQVPLRLPAADIVDVVADVGLRCTHFDAYRFFTPSAAARQRPLTRSGQVDDEQPGCVHTGMDLYRYAYEAAPFVGSDLVVACFRHARAARELDMAASPYDLSEWGLPAVPMETVAGRRDYALRQRDLALAAVPLRRRLIEQLGRTLAWAAQRGPDPAQSVRNPDAAGAR